MQVCSYERGTEEAEEPRTPPASQRQPMSPPSSPGSSTDVPEDEPPRLSDRDSAGGISQAEEENRAAQRADDIRKHWDKVSSCIDFLRKASLEAEHAKQRERMKSQAMEKELFSTRAALKQAESKAEEDKRSAQLSAEIILELERKLECLQGQQSSQEPLLQTRKEAEREDGLIEMLQARLDAKEAECSNLDSRLQQTEALLEAKEWECSNLDSRLQQTQALLEAKEWETAEAVTCEAQMLEAADARNTCQELEQAEEAREPARRSHIAHI